MPFPRPSRWVLAFPAILALLSAWPAAGMAAENLEQTSIRLLPEDAALYGATLVNREQFNIILESNAWVQLKNLSPVLFASGAIL